MNSQLERIWKETVLSQLKVLSRYLHGGTEKNHENLIQYSRFPDRYLISGCPEYEAGVSQKRHTETYRIKCNIFDSPEIKCLSKLSRLLSLGRWLRCYGHNWTSDLYGLTASYLAWND
jgi:hypothetical protein